MCRQTFNLFKTVVYDYYFKRFVEIQYMYFVLHYFLKEMYWMANIEFHHVLFYNLRYLVFKFDPPCTLDLKNIEILVHQKF